MATTAPMEGSNDEMKLMAMIDSRMLEPMNTAKSTMPPAHAQCLVVQNP